MVQDCEASGMRIRVADDDCVFGQLAKDCLGDAGYETVLVGDGAAAMGVLLSEYIDLAIVDLLMPQIDGLRLIALIRATPSLRSLPILIITSQDDPSVQADGIQVGASGYLTKPINWERLPAFVNGLIRPAM